MTLKLRDILTQDMYEKYGDMDVYSDCIDEGAPAWCGNFLTEEGKKHYAKVLELDAEIQTEYHDGATPWYSIVVKTNHLPSPTDERMWDKAQGLFGDMAGYCSEEEYDKYFTLEVPLTLEEKLANAIDWIAQQEDEWETLEKVLRNDIGLTEDEISKYKLELGYAIPWELVDSKAVMDSDGFWTDYSMWKSSSGTYAFVLGDNELYNPENTFSDWECEPEEEAKEWFDSYDGFAEEV